MASTEIFQKLILHNFCPPCFPWTQARPGHDLTVLQAVCLDLEKRLQCIQLRFMHIGERGHPGIDLNIHFILIRDVSLNISDSLIKFVRKSDLGRNSVLNGT